MSTSQTSGTSIWSIVKIPAIITLLVTILRFIGERLDWNEGLFGSAAGGGGGIVGIAWLVPIFGFYFGRRIQRSSGGPGAGKFALRVVIAILLVAIGIFAAIQADWMSFPGTPEKPAEPVGIQYALLALAVGVVVVLASWPRLGLTLLLYGLLARIPVVLVTWIALGRDWGTHYTKMPPEFPKQTGNELLMSLITPQLTVWIAFTVIIGSLAGALGAATIGKSRD